MKLPDPNSLSCVFSRLLREKLGDATIGDVIALNSEETNPDICHSHDFCDANIIMLNAWEELTGEAMDLQDVASCTIWCTAWNLAKEFEFATTTN